MKSILLHNLMKQESCSSLKRVLCVSGVREMAGIDTEDTCVGGRRIRVLLPGVPPGVTDHVLSCPGTNISCLEGFPQLHFIETQKGSG